MKTNNIILSLLTISLFISCSDEWDSHYNDTTAGRGTLWQAISGEGQLSNFSRVLQAGGYDAVLNGGQVYSVFAPTDDVLTGTEADSLIAALNSQAEEGIRKNDNTVVRQFIQNHIALYSQPVSSLTNDTVTLMNGKYALLSQERMNNCGLTDRNRLCDNGLLFTLDARNSYFPNVFEYLSHDRDLDSIARFLNRYSVYEFNEAQSVPGEIVDGQTIYLDSVTYLNNTLLNRYGLINSEDSTYWLLAPVNSEWQRLVGEYEPYFNYSDRVVKRDSLAYTHSRLAIMGGAFFSLTANPTEALSDSAVSTVAIPYNQRRLWGISESYYTYHKPFASDGIFYGTEDIQCSNGHVRKARQFRLSKYDTFLQNIKVEAENALMQDTIINAVEPLVVRRVTAGNPFFEKVSGNTFVEVIPDPATANVTIRYKIPDVLSNVAYDIYGVFVPATAYDTLAVEEAQKPSVVRVTLNWHDQKGKDTRKIFSTDITNNPCVVDTVLLVGDYQFPTCSYGLSAPQVSLTLRANVKSSQTATHSRTLRLDCIIFRPRRTVTE